MGLSNKLDFDLAGEEVGEEDEEGLEHLEGGLFIAEARLAGNIWVELIFGIAGLGMGFGVGVETGVALEPHFDEDSQEFLGVLREG